MTTWEVSEMSESNSSEERETKLAGDCARPRMANRWRRERVRKRVKFIV